MAAWRQWLGLVSPGIKAGDTPAFTPGHAAASGFGEAYQSFARAVAQMLAQGSDNEFARRFIDALNSAARYGGSSAGNDDFLNVFLRSTPRALLSAFPDAGAGHAWQQCSTTLTQWAQELLALPSVGPQREWQEMLKAVQRALLLEQQTRVTLDEHYRLASRAAVAQFAAKLEDDSGPPITTVRALYDAWIDEAEVAYAARVMSEPFAQDFAAWVNAGSDVRLAVRRLGGRMSALFDVPGREEMDALLERQHAMQRELANLRAERDATPTAAPLAPTAPAATSVHELPVERQAGTPAAKVRSRRAKSPKVSSPELAKATEKVTAPKPARPKSPALRKAKPVRGEFDISHILDAGK
jgi:hypothetical protein